eukprot:3034829-Pyramimonas_sp.AAC.1
MAPLKLRVRGGKIAICSAYAPHSGKPFVDRQAFFSDLAGFLGSHSAHGPVLLFGDFNARMHRRFPREEDVLGPFIFGNPQAQHNPESNRTLLLELCTSRKLTVGNTVFDEPPERQITYYDIGHSPADPPIHQNYGQLDLAIVSMEWL